MIAWASIIAALSGGLAVVERANGAQWAALVFAVIFTVALAFLAAVWLER